MGLCLCKNSLVTLLPFSPPRYSLFTRFQCWSYSFWKPFHSHTVYTSPAKCFHCQKHKSSLKGKIGDYFQTSVSVWIWFVCLANFLDPFWKGAGFGQKWVGDQSGVWKLCQLSQTSDGCYWQQLGLRRSQFTAYQVNHPTQLIVNIQVQKT